jgi:WD40 repeat protein
MTPTRHSNLKTHPFVSRIATDASCSRILATLSSSQVVEVAVDSGVSTPLLNGDSRPVVLLATHPSDEQLVVTVTSDNCVNVWDIRPQVKAIAGQLYVGHTITSLNFSSPTNLILGLRDTDSNGESGSVVFVELLTAGGEGSELNLPVIHRIHNVGKGAIFDAKFSPNRLIFAAASEDGSVYVYSLEAGKDVKLLNFTGILRTNNPVYAFDFSSDNKYVRLFGKYLSGKIFSISSLFDDVVEM